jgi:hypothetical protein
MDNVWSLLLGGLQVWEVSMCVVPLRFDSVLASCLSNRSSIIMFFLHYDSTPEMGFTSILQNFWAFQPSGLLQYRWRNSQPLVKSSVCYIQGASKYKGLSWGILNDMQSFGIPVYRRSSSNGDPPIPGAPTLPHLGCSPITPALCRWTGTVAFVRPGGYEALNT